MVPIYFQEALTVQNSHLATKDLERLREERKHIQNDMRQERSLLDAIKQERIDLESDVRRLRKTKEHQEKRLR